MIVLTLRTDAPEAEVGIYKDNQQLNLFTWTAHRQLSETIHQVIKQELEKARLTFSNIEGIAIYAGPGSFTGLRIGFAVGNALAASLSIPVAVSNDEHDWAKQAISVLQAGKGSSAAVPEYGALPFTTKQKK